MWPPMQLRHGTPLLAAPFGCGPAQPRPAALVGAGGFAGGWLAVPHRCCRVAARQRVCVCVCVGMPGLMQQAGRRYSSRAACRALHGHRVGAPRRSHWRCHGQRSDERHGSQLIGQWGGPSSLCSGQGWRRHRRYVTHQHCDVHGFIVPAPRKPCTRPSATSSTSRSSQSRYRAIWIRGAGNCYRGTSG